MADWQPAHPEKFDPDWDYTFAWAFNGYKNEAHVWRLPVGKDGQTTHRAEAEALFGRAPKVTQKDSLGLASYIPEEIKLDGTLVAPPHVLVESYYGHEIPDALHGELAKLFPDAVVRNARISSVADPKTPRTSSRMRHIVAAPTVMYHATHAENSAQILREGLRPGAFLAEDPEDAAMWNEFVISVNVEGLRVVPDEEGTRDLESGQMWKCEDPIGPERLSSVDDPELRSDFSTPPDYHLRPPNIQSSHWAQVQFNPSGDRVPPPWLSNSLRRAPVASGDASGADHSGAMICLYLPDEVGEQIHIEGGEPVEELHITLAYFVDKADDRDDWDDLEKIVERFAKRHGELTGTIGGYGVFHNDVDVLWASADLPGINELRHEIVEAAEDAGFMVSKDHSFSPHITLEYDHKGKLPKRDPIEVVFPDLCLTVKNERTSFGFTGEGFFKEL